MAPKVIIIGAGISGLSAGCYLAMNGFKPIIFERHVIPGGCCTAWSRRGYVFDYCIDWLIGSGEGNDAHRVWQELGALDGKSVQNFDLFNRVVDQKGHEINFYNDPHRLEQHLLELAPEDRRVIKAFCRDLKSFTKLNLTQSLKPKPLMNTFERMREVLKILPHFLLLWRTASTQMKTFAERIKNPQLKTAINYIFFQDPETFPLLPFLYNMACAHNNNAGFPEGGSLGLAKSIEERYLSLGGKIVYGEHAVKILTEDHRTTGVLFKKGRREEADLIISASDARSTIYELLEGRYVDPTIDQLFKVCLEQPGVLFPSVISVFIGYKGQVGQDDAHSTTYLLDPDEAKDLPGVSQNCLVVQHRSRYADGFAPMGHSIIHCTYFSDFWYWQNLRNSDKACYRRQKHQIINFISGFLERRFLGLKDNIQVVEVATPATTKRYTGNFQGSIFGWKAFSEAEDLALHLVNRLGMKLPGLKGFYITGQWILGGGLPRAALSGRYVTQFLCDDLGRSFRADTSQNKRSWQKSCLGVLPEIDEELVNP